MICTREEDALEEFLALRGGTLSVRGRFRLGRHIGNCAKCRLMLEVELEYIEKTAGVHPGSRYVKALALLADIKTSETAPWFKGRFFKVEAL